jgi:hypothetical protein
MYRNSRRIPIHTFKEQLRALSIVWSDGRLREEFILAGFPSVLLYSTNPIHIREITQWCIENFGDRWADTQWEFFFDNDEDALQFKLTWMQ